MMLERLLVPVADAKRARVFYERVFGFVALEPVQGAANDNAGNGGIELHAPGAPLAITLVSESNGLPSGSVQSAYLDVADISQAHAHIKAQGAQPGPIEQGRVGPFFRIADPDGNGWIIRQV
jgi:predicted enzyme related to lactoylglutathione lyase